MITAELDPELAHGVMDMFAEDDIDVMHADWSSLAEHGPFSLIFMDAGSAKSAGRGRRSSTCSTDGGMIVLDDFMPCADLAAAGAGPGRHPAAGLAVATSASPAST